MDSLVSIFHIDVKLIIAQAVNFAIVFLVLYKFAFKPIAKVMSERTNTIEKSLKDAKEIEERLALAKDESSVLLSAAKKEAMEIVERAQKQSESNRQSAIAKTKEELAIIVSSERAKIVAEKEETIKEIRQEAAELVVRATEKVIGTVLDSDKNRELIEKAIKDTK